MDRNSSSSRHHEPKRATPQSVAASIVIQIVKKVERVPLLGLRHLENVSSFTMTTELAPAPAISTDDVLEYLPWKIAFRVQFQSERLGLRFHPAQFPDTGNGVYTIRLRELSQGPDGTGPALEYNASLRVDQVHLTLRPGLYLTHIGDNHLVDVPCEDVIRSIQSAPRPVTLRFVDVEAGVVTPQELRDSLHLDTSSPPSSPRMARVTSGAPGSPSSTMKATSPTSTPLYKIILLGTAGVGKSSLLSVAVNGDAGYQERRPTTLEAEFGSLDFSDSNTGGKGHIKARVWDTAGQERYRAITRSHYRRADGALLVYDMTEPESFDKLGGWLRALRETAGDSLTAITVIENKIDQVPPSLPRPRGTVDLDQVRAFCEQHDLMFARTTAKLNREAGSWGQGRKVLDVIKQLVLTVHGQRSSGARNGGDGAEARRSPGEDVIQGDRLVLKDAPATSRPLSGDCGPCGRS